MYLRPIDVNRSRRIVQIRANGRRASVQYYVGREEMKRPRLYR